jgi:hypothetical protein
MCYSDGSCLKSYVFEKYAEENSEQNQINLSKIYKYITSTNLLIFYSSVGIVKKHMQNFKRGHSEDRMNTTLQKYGQVIWYENQ